MKSWPDARYRKRIEDLRIPAVKGLSDDTYRMLHRTFVEIVAMRRSIESVDARLAESRKAILEAEELLKRLSPLG